MATNPITLLDGTTAFASDVETKVNPLYTSLDYTNFSASAISGTGTKLLTDISPSISTSLILNATAKLYLDGVSGVGGDTYISEPSANNFRITAGGVGILDASPSGGVQFNNASSVTALTSAWPSRLSLLNTDATTNAGSAIECYNSFGVMMGKIACVNVDNTAASEDSKFSILTRRAGTLSQVMTIEGDVFRFQPGGTERIGVDGSVATTSLLTFPNCQQTTGNVISVSAADSLTTGSILNLVSNSSSSSTRSLISVINDNTSATGTDCISIRQDANQSALTITGSGPSSSTPLLSVSDTSGTGRCANFVKNTNTASNLIAVLITCQNAGAGTAVGIDLTNCNDSVFAMPTDNTSIATSTTNSTGRIQIFDASGNTRYIPYFT